MVKKSLFSFSLVLLLSTNVNVLAENESLEENLLENISCECENPEECVECGDAENRCACKKKKNKVNRSKRSCQQMLECADCISVRLTVERDENNPRWEAFAANACGLMSSLAYADKEDAVKTMRSIYEMAVASGLETDLSIDTEADESEAIERSEDEALDPATVIESKRIVVKCSIENPRKESPIWRSITEKAAEIASEEAGEFEEAQANDALELGQEIIELVSEASEDVHGKISIIAETDTADEEAQADA